MKCVNAVWEERNLGVKTIEVVIEKQDIGLTEKEICAQIESFKTDYQAKYVVVKVNTKYPVISQQIQKSGYIFVESQIGLKITRESAKESFNKYKDLFIDVDYKHVDKNALSYVVDEINKGIFTTDRIALDVHFGVNVANRRYALWTEDEVNRGADLFFSYYNNIPIGFFLEKKVSSGSTVGLLGGLFVGGETKNYGGLFIASGLKHFLDGGGVAEKTKVSSNNVPILQLHLMFGRNVTDISNVFIKHY